MCETLPQKSQTPVPSFLSHPRKEVSMQPARYIGLDIHKYYLIAVGVDADQNQVYGPKRVEWPDFEEWISKDLTNQDSVVIEMTTNSWKTYDILVQYVHSVTVVHPPYVSLVVRARVKTDKKAALTLAQLHAAHLLPGIWIPPIEVRELRALVAQRRKMTILSSQSKNRLHAVLHRQQILPPPELELFHPDLQPWWEGLNVSPIEKVRILSDLQTLEFAQKQKLLFEDYLGQMAANDERVSFLIQIPGFGLINSMTVLGAIGDIRRFPDATKLVGYAGLGASVHASGEQYTTGRITKTGRRDLRAAMVEAANVAVQHHVFWKKEFQRMEMHLGRSKTVVAIARKLLITVWNVLMKQVADKHADARDVACSMFALAYRVKVRNLPNGVSAKQFVRNELDRLGIGADLQTIPWGTKQVKLPPSILTR
jgi:transposase